MPQPDATPFPRKPLHETIGPRLSVIAQGLGALGASLYVIGYVAVNAYLSKFGVAPRGPISFQYVPAGLALGILLAEFAALVGVRVWRLEDDVRSFIAWKPTRFNELAWGTLSYVSCLSGIAFSAVMVALWFTALFVGGADNRVWLPPTVFFLVDYPLEIHGVYRRIPLLKLTVTMALNLIGLWYVPTHAPSQPFLILMAMILAMAFFLNLLIDIRRRFRPPFLLDFVEGISMVLVFAVTYGALVYGNVPQGLGGGRPTRVRLLVSTQGTTALQRIVKVDSSLSEEVGLLADDGDELLFLLPEPTGGKGGRRVARLSKRLVDGVLPDPELSIWK